MGNQAINPRIDIWTDRIVWFVVTTGVLGMLLLVLVVVTDGLGERRHVRSGFGGGAEVSASPPAVTAPAPNGATAPSRSKPPPGEPANVE